MFGRSLRDVLRTYAHQFGRVIAIQALLVIAFTIITIIVALLARQAVVQLMGYIAPEGQAVPERVLVVAGVVALIGAVVLLPFGIATIAATIGIADDSLAGRRTSLFRWLGRGLMRWLPVTAAVVVAVVVPIALLFASPVLVLVGLVGLAVIGILRVVRSRNADASGPLPSTRIWALMAIPFRLAVLAIPTALLVVPGAVLEPAGPMEAWRIAQRQVSGRRVAVFGTVAIAFAAYVCISALSSWLLPLLLDSVAAEFLSLVLAVVLLPAMPIAMASAYRDAAGPSGRVLEPAVRRARAAKRRAAEPGVVARVAVLVVASLVIGGAVAVPSPAFADGAPAVTPTIALTAANTVALGDTLGIDVAVSDLAGLTYPSAGIKYWVYQGSPAPDPAFDSVSGWPDGGVRTLTLPDGRAHIDVDSGYLAPGVYHLKVYFEPAPQDAAKVTTAVTDVDFTVIPRTRVTVTAPTAALGDPSAVTATVANVDGSDAPQGTVEFRWRANADTVWSVWSAPVGLADAGGYGAASLPGGLTLGAVGAYRVEAHYVPSGLFASSADADVLLIVGSKPTFREIISYSEPHAGAPTTFVVRVEAYGNGPDAVTSIPPSGDVSLYLYEISTPTGNPFGPQLASCPGAPLTPVPGETLVWQYSCTVSFGTPGKYGLVSIGYSDDLWQLSGTSYTPDQRFAVGDVVKGDPTLSLSTAATSWVGNQTIPLQWSITGPSSGVALILSRDGVPITTLSGTSGTYNAVLPANLGLSADSINTTFTLAYAGSTLWNTGSTTLTRGVTACIPVVAGTVSPSGGGTISLATPTTCGSGSSAGFTPGTTVHWTVTPSDTTTRTGVHLSGSADPSLVIVGGTDVSTVVDRARALALTAEFETTCATVTVPLSVSVDESSNCGPTTGWGLIVSGGTILKSNTFLAGTILHLGYTLPDATSTFTGWSGPIASGASTDAKVGARVTNSGLGVTPVFSPMCFPVTLAQQGAVGIGSITSSANCRLPGVVSPGNAYNGYAAGTNVAVSVTRPSTDDSYTASIIVAQQGSPAAQTSFPAYQGGSLRVSTGFVVTAPTTVSWTQGRCVLIQTVGVNANHDRDAAFGNQYLYSHISSPGCGNHPPRAVGPTGYDSSAFVAIGDTVSISSSLPAGSTGIWANLHFQGWKRGQSDPSGFTPPNQAAFQWKVTGPADFEAYWGQEVNCQPITVVMVPSNAFSNVQLSSEQASGCPAGTFDLADTLSVGSGAATVRISATPNSAVSQGAVYGIGYATNSYSASTKATAPVNATPTGGLSRAIPAFGATTITLYACQAVTASAQLKSPADGKYYPADLSQNDFFFVSPAQNCVIDGKSYWSVGSTVDVAAAPEGSGYRFTGWEGQPGTVDGTIVTVRLTGTGRGPSVVADFDLTCYVLTSNYAEGVNVSPAPNCPGYAASEHKWVAGAVIALTVDDTVMKNNQTYFDGWTGGPDSASGKTAGVILSADRAVYANFRSNDLGSALGRTASALAQTYVGVIAGALGGLLLGSNPVTAVLGIVNTVLGGIVKIAGALGASGSVLNALSSAADATQWLTNLITAPMGCISNWSGGEGGPAGTGSSTLAGQAGRSIGNAVSKEWTRMAQGGEQSATSAAGSVVGGALSSFQVMNSWIANLDNDPAQTWSSFTSSFASCMAQSVYPPGS